MARIRSLKPEFWTDSKVVRLSPSARLLFLGLLNFADDDGRMAFDLLTIKLQILPLDPTDCSGELGEIRGNSMVTVYEVDGREYLQITNFSKHQKVDKRSASKFPPPPPNPAESRRIPPNPADRREGKGEESKGEESKGEGYAFCGKVIRLNHQDFGAWKNSYHAIPDFIAELDSLDRHYQSKGSDDWFHRAPRSLAKAHQEWLSKKQADPKRDPRGPYYGPEARGNVTSV